LRLGHNLNQQVRRAFHIRKYLEATQLVIDKCIQHYEETGGLNALKIAFDGYVTLSEMLNEVAEICSYGNDFELTK